MLLIAFLGGLLTVLSPCILPVVPFLFARANQSRASIVLTLVGMAMTFAAVSSLAVVSSGWVAQASQGGRYLALLVMVVFALSLLSTRVATWLARPLVALGNRLDPGAKRLTGPLASVGLGVATGLLWAPCAGPILGVILSGAMLQGANAQTSVLLLVYGLGSAVSLGALILAGKGLVNRLRVSLPVLSGVRRVVGGGVLLTALAIASGSSQALLAGTSSQVANGLEQSVLKAVTSALDHLVSKVQAQPMPELANQGPMPSLDGAVQWLNSPELSAESLRGKVVLVDFWTFDCINCQHTLPYVKQWAQRYEKDGLVVIGVHTPEYGFERVLANVQEQVRNLGITYPVAVDNDYRIWRAFNNLYWPAHYLIDANGQVRYSHFGEGAYAAQEQAIQALLAEAKAQRSQP
ncbi:cytochrome c biogenesis protein DipZ [Pseudomonas sp. GV071]|jgi:cytochrome c biogenesis protein CcdA/thiol-disulfide isomerase/thioredoxin|uniref:cytochrome c biogenesis protein DipZ n=1 Tax=Pseudomonas sp. GV071 TaxID=2135754 RepID=UPI000D394EDB|nr:cytochrome c biogenesis protein DipZ [Pseudomonas sp. GV071]PTQ70525.1 cytochrome c biogenesis protein CcdA [Pseudomonas sp. GV071]